MLQDHIFLVGMAGCGKTSLGQRLAQAMGRPFVDTDQRISEILSMSVNDIYATLGEDFFRIPTGGCDGEGARLHGAEEIAGNLLPFIH